MLRESLRAARANADRDLDLLARQRRLEVVEWRHPASGSDPHWPEPWASERLGNEPHWLDNEDGGGGDRVGFDDAGRPVVREVDWGDDIEPRVVEVWLHEQGRSDRMTRDDSLRLHVEEGRLAAVVGVELDEIQVERWSWEGGRPVRCDIARVWEDEVISVAEVPEFDANDRLLRLWSKQDISPRVDDDEIEAVERSLQRAGELVPDHVEFDYRLQRREPRLRGSKELVALLSEAIEAAVVAAVAAAAIENPFVVEVRPHDGRLPPFARVGSARFRDRMRAKSPEPEAASLFKAEPPEGAELELTDHLADEPLRACRELRWALSTEAGDEKPERQRAVEACERLGRELSARLNARSWPGAAEPFLALVHIGHPYMETDPFELAMPTVGAQRVAAFRASVASEAGMLGGLPDAARTDRQELAALLTQRGLGDQAERIAAEIAEAGNRLVPGPDGVRSRLGGPGMLPPEEPWPCARGERPLTFLAGIDLAELSVRDGLPEAGWLLFFADLDNDEAGGLVDFAANAPGEAARLFYLPPGVDPSEIEPPAALKDVLAARPVEAAVQLTLPDDYEAGERLGLDPAESETYEEIARSLRYGEEGSSTALSDHWVLGALTGVQGHPPDEDTRLLLQLAWDEDLGFELLDGGTVQFRIARAALEAGDWSAAVGEADSA